MQKTKAREAEIVLPWEKAGNSEISNSDNAKQVVGHQKDVAGLGFNSVPNYYGRLDHKTNRIGGSPPVIDMKKIQTSNSTNVVCEVVLTLFTQYLLHCNLRRDDYSHVIFRVNINVLFIFIEL